VTNDGTSPAVRVISTASNTVVATLPIPGRDRALGAPLGGRERALTARRGTSSGGEIVRVNAAGASSSILEFAPLSSSPAEMGFSEQLREVVAAQPIADGVDLVRYVASSIYCAGRSELRRPGRADELLGDDEHRDQRLHAPRERLAADEVGVLLLRARRSRLVPFGDGFRCAGGTIGRLRPATLANRRGAQPAPRELHRPAGEHGRRRRSCPGRRRTSATGIAIRADPAGRESNLADGLAVTFAP
jgi:hypothetical protein